MFQKWFKNQAVAAILISIKIDFKPKLIKRHGERHFLLIKGKKSTKRMLQFSPSINAFVSSDMALSYRGEPFPRSRSF